MRQATIVACATTFFFRLIFYLLLIQSMAKGPSVRLDKAGTGRIVPLTNRSNPLAPDPLLGRPQKIAPPPHPPPSAASTGRSRRLKRFILLLGRRGDE